MADTEHKEAGGKRPGGKLTWVEAVVLRHRITCHIIIHTFIFSLGLLLAYLVMSDITLRKEPWFLVSFLPTLPVFIILKLLIFGKLKLFRSGWQYASIRDVANILLGSWLFLLIVFAVVYTVCYVPPLFGRQVPELFQAYPKGLPLLDFLATVFLVSTARLGFRIYREELRPVSSEGVRRVLVVGAGNASETIIREIHRMRVERYRVIGLVDDNPTKKSLLIHGIPVLGRTSDIPHICEEKRIEEIIIAIPSATQKQLRRVIEQCSGTKLKFQLLPSMADLIDGRMTVSQIHPVDINDLLGREAVKLDDQAVAKFLRGRRVLITGAGGSIGSEMCRQICHYGPAKLILVEQAETPLFDMENELRLAHPEIPIIARICDIFDRRRVMDIWSRFKPDVVVHAAAHKHVPMMEHNPCEAIKNNILGTKNVADASCEHSVAEFVLISTDKAVNPSSVMGASKRVAEIYTQALPTRGDCDTQFKAVRFGNVLGSSGSVIPTFRNQIARGGPVSVTHPDMTRYFMTIPEAARLVLQAAATGTGGQIYLLDMGEPVKIIDLARQMITLSGFRPDEDIEIKIVGVRPGEKLFEELRTDGEDLEPTVHPKVNVWKSRSVQWSEAQRYIKQLSELQNCLDRQPIVDALKRIVPEYEPLNPPRDIDVASPRTPAIDQAQQEVSETTER